MYTGLRFKGYVKPEYREIVQKIMDYECVWKDFSCIPSVFSKDIRSMSIPFGDIFYMPESWGEYEKDDTATDGFRDSFDIETGYWSFQCSLKNYDDTIGSFLNYVVPLIIEEIVHCEKLYEVDDHGTFYKLEYGKIVEMPYAEIENLKHKEKAKEFIENNVMKSVVNQLPTRVLYRHPDVAKLGEEEANKGESFFYPHFENGKCINKPEVMYVAKFEWNEEEYKEFMRGLE